MVKVRKINQKGKGEGGQVLLIVILVIIISLTIGLSLASRSIINLRTSTEEADSQKALAAAEAGIEKTLQDIAASSGTFSANNSRYTTTVESQGGNTFLLNGGSPVTQNDGVDVWLADHNSDGTINYSTVKSPQFFHIYWGVDSEDDCDSADPSRWPAAIEVVVVSGTDSINVATTRYAYDRCDGTGGAPDRNNNFEGAQGTSASFFTGGPTFKIRTPEGVVQGINITDGIFLRVIPIYKNSIIGVRACNHGGGQCADPVLPSQGFQITSTGTAGSASRKISVFKGYSQTFLPYISYGLFVPARL